MLRPWLLLAALSLATHADSWAPARRQEVWSPRHRFLFVIEPPRVRGIAGLIGMNNGPQKCWGTLFQQTAPGCRKQLWSRPLDNQLSPVSALVSDTGREVVTFDNWATVGYGPNVVAIYGATGTLRVRHSLEELMPPAEIKRIPHSISSRWWQRGAWLDESDGQLVLVTGERTLKRVHLESGRLSPPTRETLPRALRQQANEELQLALELADETHLPCRTQAALVFEAAHPAAVRLRAALLLKHQGDSRGASFTASQARHGKGDDRCYALKHLAEFQGTASLSTLQSALASAQGEVCSSAREGLQRLGSAAVPSLIVLLGSPASSDARASAAAVLGDLRARAAVPALLDTVSDSNPTVAEAALEALQAVGVSPSANKRLSELLLRGTRIDAQIARHFATRRYPASAPALAQALERGARLPQDHGLQPLRPAVVEALQNQTGVHLNDDPGLWRTWLRAQPTEAKNRGQLLASLGDPDGLLWQAQDPLSPDQVKEIATTLSNFPQLQALKSDSRCSYTLDPAGRSLLYQPDGRPLELLTVPQLQPVPLTSERPCQLYGAHFSPDGSHALLNSDEQFCAVDVTTGARVGHWLEGGLDFGRASISRDATWIVPRGYSDRVYAYNSRDAQSQKTLEYSGNSGCSAVSPDGTLLALCSTTVQIFNLTDGSQQQWTPSGAADFDDAFFLDDSRTLVTYRRSGSLDLWSPQGQLVYRRPTPKGTAFHHSVSGQRFALGLAGRAGVLVGDVHGADYLAREHNQALSLRGTRLATCGDTTNLQVLDTQTGQLLATIPSHRDAEEIVSEAVLSADGTHLVTLGTNDSSSTLRVWRLPGQSPDTDVPPALLQLQVQRATGHRLDHGKLHNLTPDEYAQVCAACQTAEAAHQPHCQHPETPAP